LRQISADFFGFSGANNHIILDDTIHTVEALVFVGSHRILISLSLSNRANVVTHTLSDTKWEHGVNHAIINTKGLNRASHGSKKGSKVTPGYQLVTWSASDKAALKRMLHLYDESLRMFMHGNANSLADLAYMLAARRTLMTWNSFSAVNGQGTSKASDLPAAKFERAAREVELPFQVLLPPNRES
jgi:acyl transferase domain-containing protein